MRKPASPHASRLWLRPSLVGVFGLFLFATACTLSTGEVVTVRFDNTAIGETVLPLNTGTGQAFTDVVLLTENGGTAITEAHVGGQGHRANYPDFDDTMTGPRAVVRVTNNSTTDHLNPGPRDFHYGADVVLDALSVGGAIDNGNNAFQRGLFDDSAQFKLEVEPRPRCRIKGDLGALQVTSSVSVQPGEPYRVRCFRAGESLTVSVRQINADGSTEPAVTNTVQGPLGPLTYILETPISIGGKLNASGNIAVNSSDQFNGSIDNAILVMDS